MCGGDRADFDNAAGVLLHCGLRGSATIEASSPARFRRLLLKYLGAQEHWNEWFLDTVAKTEDPTNRMIRLAPESIFTNNVSFFRTGPDYAWP
ncbi:hypothetical protein ACHMW4_21300 [Mesorhizobium sp. UC22_110]|uniref:hypothetical protein n=1 Tax=Mesorhizobium sp. UC22_110 TaxID=3374552 RepID=UPI003757E41E